MQDMIWSVLPRHGDQPDIQQHVSSPVLAGAVRLAILAAGCTVALLAYGVLGNAISLVGGVASMSCSLLLPSSFYLALFWRDLHRPARAGVVLLLTLGVAVHALVLVCHALAWR